MIARKKIVLVGAGSDIAKTLKPKLLEHGANVKAFTAKELDVTSLSYIGRITREQPDILIVFSGVITPSSVFAGSPSDWHKQINVNLIGSYNATYAALQGNARCRVILIGSSSAYKPRGNWSAYCASKAGLSMFVRCAIEEGIDIWCLNIARTDTKMRRSLFKGESSSTLLTTEEVSQEILKVIYDRQPQRVMSVSKKAETDLV